MTSWLRLLTPTYRVVAAYHLEPALLRRWGIEALMLDLDNTLVPWGSTTPPEPIAAWMRDLRAAGIRGCLVSNTWSRRGRLTAELLGLPAAAGRMKPSTHKLRDALRILGSAPARTAMVGDQLFTDVLAGNRLGVPTVLTGPLIPEEPLRVRGVRVLERWVLRLVEARGAVPTARKP